MGCGRAAHFTYTFSGHLHGTDTGRRRAVAGHVREDITFDDGTAHLHDERTGLIPDSPRGAGPRIGVGPPTGRYHQARNPERYPLFSFQVSNDQVLTC